MKQRCIALETELASAHATSRALQERVAATFAERTDELRMLQQQVAVLSAEKHGLEEVVRVVRSETETMRAHAAISEERCHELEKQREDVAAALDVERVQALRSAVGSWASRSLKASQAA